MAFSAAMKHFFGLKPGQSIMEFGAELKQLTFDDKMEFAKMLRAQGIPSDDPQTPTPK